MFKGFKNYNWVSIIIFLILFTILIFSITHLREGWAGIHKPKKHFKHIADVSKRNVSHFAKANLLDVHPRFKN